MADLRRLTPAAPAEEFEEELEELLVLLGVGPDRKLKNKRLR